MITVKISDKITKPGIFTITLLISDYDLGCFFGEVDRLSDTDNIHDNVYGNGHFNGNCSIKAITLTHRLRKDLLPGEDMRLVASLPVHQDPVDVGR